MNPNQCPSKPKAAKTPKRSVKQSNTVDLVVSTRRKSVELQPQPTLVEISKGRLSPAPTVEGVVSPTSGVRYLQTRKTNSFRRPLAATDVPTPTGTPPVRLTDRTDINMRTQRRVRSLESKQSSAEWERLIEEGSTIDSLLRQVHESRSTLAAVPRDTHLWIENQLELPRFANATLPLHILIDEAAAFQRREKMRFLESSASKVVAPRPESLWKLDLTATNLAWVDLTFEDNVRFLHALVHFKPDYICDPSRVSEQNSALTSAKLFSAVQALRNPFSPIPSPPTSPTAKPCPKEEDRMTRVIGVKRKLLQELRLFKWHAQP